MLIEFTGPSASGKTEFVRHLLKTWPETRSVRRSGSSTASPTGPKLWAAALHSQQIPRAFWNAYKWHRNGFALSSHPLRTSLRMAAEYCLLHGASKDSSLWLLDQGRLQLGSWLPQHVCRDPMPYAQALREFVRFGDGVVLISLHPEFSVKRMTQRGDGERAEMIAKQRGYKSALDYAAEVFNHQDPMKVRLAQSFGSTVLLNVINEHGHIKTQDIVGAAHEMEKLADAFREWWCP